jgi:Na+-driven multidrug efflux pump
VGVLFAVASRLATAVGANRSLAQVGTVALVVNVVADWILARRWGVAGLALSTAVVRVAAIGLLLAMLRRREPRLSFRVPADSERLCFLEKLDHGSNKASFDWLVAMRACFFHAQFTGAL